MLDTLKKNIKALSSPGIANIKPLCLMLPSKAIYPTFIIIGILQLDNWVISYIENLYWTFLFCYLQLFSFCMRQKAYFWPPSA